MILPLSHDSDKGEIFVANQGSNFVSIISDVINTPSTSGIHTGTLTNGTNSPDETHTVGSLPVPEFLMALVALIALIGAGIYLAMRYRKRAL